MKTVTIITPFYNEEENVDVFFEEVSKVTDELGSYNFSYICIDDGSNDQTLTKLITHQESKTIEIIEFSRNFGKESAITAGLDHFNADIAIVIDSDLQDPPNLIIQMLNELNDGYEVVTATRTDRSEDTFFKRISARLFYKAHNAFSEHQIPENVGDYRAMTAQVVQEIRRLREKNRFMKGILSWVGFKTTTIDYKRPQRKKGETKFTIWKLWNFAVDGITSFSSMPIKVWTYIGVLIAFVSLIYALFILTRTLIFGVDVPGYASILIFILFLGSLQLISIGLIGEYIGRIYMEVKERPIYVVKRVHKK
ncbi:MAG: glycosyltransferase [Gammaproteobacteria bacterium]|nr:glycosyltransferase [Gammaproteobacteria bacterium]|tara:strand:- start:1937 stop:2863 length:927 start_codon:yes stop_codon:yes gene_type:complete